MRDTPKKGSNYSKADDVINDIHEILLDLDLTDCDKLDQINEIIDEYQ